MTTTASDPWIDETPVTAPKPVQASAGAAVLDTVRAFIGRFTTLPSEAALDIATLFAAHTHVVGANERLAFDTSPRLVFLSDKPGSGKSMSMETVLRMCFHPEQVIDPTPATFAEAISERRATVGIDELDVLFGKGAAKATLRSLLNAGYRQGAVWQRANRTPVSVYSPVTMAGLGAKFRTAQELSPLRSRSIMIEMQPGHRGETYRPREHNAYAAALNESLSTWCRRNARVITATWPDMPEGIEARAAEVAEPLLMVADAAAGRWPQAARDAVRELMLGETESPDELALSDRLLADLRTVFGEEDTMTTVDIIDGLFALPYSVWPKLWPNVNTAPRELAAMLLPLGVNPVPVRVGEHVLRGFQRGFLSPLWDMVSVPLG
jgi:hypothetical protein